MIERTVNGMIATGFPHIKPTKITARLTVDKLGKTFSLADEERGIMLAVPIDALSDWLEVRLKEC